MISFFKQIFTSTKEAKYNKNLLKAINNTNLLNNCKEKINFDELV